MTPKTRRERTAGWSRISRLQGQGLFPQISVIRSACGQKLRDKRNSINKMENAPSAKKRKLWTRRKDTTRRGMPMAEKLTTRITLKCAKEIATRNYTSQIRRQELSHDE